MLIMFVLNIFYVYSVRDRIPFATVLIELSVDVMKLFPHCITVAFASLFVQAAWIGLWGFAAAAARDYTTSSTDGSSSIAQIYLVLCFYWTSQVISNVVLVTVSGIFGEWYYQYPAMAPDATRRSLLRSLTTSFGTICFGSFLIAVVKTLRFIVHRARQSENSFARTCADCLLNCLEDILEYFNLYAFVYVSIYGSSYCHAAKSVWELFKNHGWDVIINDNLIGGVLTLGSIFCGVIVAVFSYFIAENAMDLSYAGTVGLVGFFVGPVFSFCALTIVQSGVSTILVCYCENSQVLQETKPDVSEKLNEAFHARYGDKNII